MMTKITVKKALKKISGAPAFQGPPKNQNSIRSVKLPEFIFELFKKYHKLQLELKTNMGDKWHETGYVFTQINGLPMSLDTIGWYMGKLSKKHNLKKVHPHALRHSNASILVASGQDIKTVSHRLGHVYLSIKKFSVWSRKVVHLPTQFCSLADGRPISF